MSTEVGVPLSVLNFLVMTPQKNRVTIGDRVAELSPFTQTISPARENDLRPLVFSILLKGCPD